MKTHALLLVALAACSGSSDDAADPKDRDPDGAVEYPTPTGTGTPGSTEEPPAVVEIPCNGVDDDGDGRPAPDASCAPDADILVHATGLNWPYNRIVPDFDGDGLDDVLAVSGNGPRKAELLNGLTGEELATVKKWGPRGISEPATVGEFDGVAGLDIWVGEELFHDPVGTDGEPDASRPEAQWALYGAADFDGDGIDDLVAAGSMPGATLLDWYIGTGPFVGATGDRFAPFAPRAKDVEVAGDLDGDGLEDLLVTWPDGSADLAHADGAVFATIDPPMVPRPGGDFDGDGVADLIAGWTEYVEAGRDCDHWQLAGPFSGAVAYDPAVWLTNPVICEELTTFPDIDGDGGTDYAALVDGTWTAYFGDRMPAAGDDLVQSAALAMPFEAISSYGGVTAGNIDGEPGLDVLVDHYQADGALYLNVGF